MQNFEPQICIYTDGSALGNPGAGGFGTKLTIPGKNHSKTISQGYRLTTNNRMELLAVIVGLEAIKKPQQRVLIISDSQYVINAIEKKWLTNWVKKSFKNVKNPDLWYRLYPLLSIHEVRFQWIKGHAGHFYNEQCDQLAVSAAKSKKLLIDKYYEENKQ